MAGEDQAYLDRVRELPCAARDLLDFCEGAVEAHHAGSRGVGQKAHDNTAVPFCRRHHRAWHDLGKPFRAMPRDYRPIWMAEVIETTRKAIGK